jgi:hypothetical protein
VGGRDAGVTARSHRAGGGLPFAPRRRDRRRDPARKGFVMQESPGQGPGLPLCTSLSLARSATHSHRCKGGYNAVESQVWLRTARLCGVRAGSWDPDFARTRTAGLRPTLQGPGRPMMRAREAGAAPRGAQRPGAQRAPARGQVDPVGVEMWNGTTDSTAAQGRAVWAAPDAPGHNASALAPRVAASSFVRQSQDHRSAADWSVSWTAVDIWEPSLRGDGIS